jgi:hypothetical protein
MDSLKRKRRQSAVAEKQYSTWHDKVSRISVSAEMFANNISSLALGQLLISPLAAKLASKGKLCPLGVNFVPSWRTLPLK